MLACKGIFATVFTSACVFTKNERQRKFEESPPYKKIIISNINILDFADIVFRQ